MLLSRDLAPVLVALVVLVIALGGEARAKGEPELLDLANGEILIASEDTPGSDGATFVARAVVDAPPAVVWSVVSRCGDYQRVMPRIAASAELARAGDIVTCRVTADLPFPLPDLTSTTRAVHREDAAAMRYQREWKLVEGDFEVNEGAWILEPAFGGQKTYAVYRLRVKPKLPVPTSLASMFQKGPLVDAMKAVRAESKKRLQSAATKR